MSRFLPAIRVSQILQRAGLNTMPDLEMKLPTGAADAYPSPLPDLYAGEPVTVVVKASDLKGNLTLDLSPGFGYAGIVVAMLALLHPFGVVAAAIFVAGIFVGADAMSRSAGVPSYIAQVMVATALLTMVTAVMFTRYRLRWG